MSGCAEALPMTVGRSPCVKFARSIPHCTTAQPPPRASRSNLLAQFAVGSTCDANEPTEEEASTGEDTTNLGQTIRIDDERVRAMSFAAASMPPTSQISAPGAVTADFSNVDKPQDLAETLSHGRSHGRDAIDDAQWRHRAADAQQLCGTDCAVQVRAMNVYAALKASIFSRRGPRTRWRPPRIPRRQPRRKLDCDYRRSQ